MFAEASGIASLHPVAQVAGIVGIVVVAVCFIWCVFKS